VIILGALHQVGSALYLYWDVEWFDMFMHFIGGFTIGLLFIWAWYGSDMFGTRAMPAKASVILLAIAFAFAVGAAWEGFEYIFDIANPTGGNYPMDTMNDFVADLLGALIGGLIGTIRKFHE